MRNPKLSMAICFLLFIFPTLLFSQKPPIKPGKISIEELNMDHCPIDSNAHAMIICDYGKSYFIYSDKLGFQLFFDRIIRIKIFTKEGYDWADHSISLYKNESDKEKIRTLKASTYNLENGKIVKTKLKKSDIFSVEKSKHIDLEKFSMPQVREGSVIEIEYSILSEFFFNLNSWYFQHDIPTQWSEYNTKIPEYFRYKKTHKGYVGLVENESEIRGMTVNISSKERTTNARKVQSTTYENSQLEYDEVREHWAAKDVPAFIEEEPLTSSENYISKMEFELSSIHPPYGTISYYTKSWDDINELLLDNTKFGGQLNGGGYLKDMVEIISLTDGDNYSKMVLAFQYIQKLMKWDGNNSLYVDDNIRSAFEGKSGNSADINLMLVVLLEKLGIKSDPVVVSTRSNGMINPSQPTLSSFNYIIASAVVDDQRYLMDATSAKIPFGMLPKRALNGKGRLISKSQSDWVELDTDKAYKTFSMYTLGLNEDMEFTGSIQSAYYDYAAYSKRNRLDNYPNKEDYIENLVNTNTGLLINKYELINTDNYSETYKEKFEISITDKTEGSEEIIYFNPMFYEGITENPFKLEERKYPVEYAYPVNNSYMLILTIPEGFKVDEMPENCDVTLPNDGGRFIFTSKVMGKNLQINSKVQITKKIFVPEDYESLKEFYNNIISKHAEHVVLSKE